MRRTVVIHTLGCSKNRVDSERLAQQIEASGDRVFLETEPESGARVDLVILNTCGFIHDAKQESIDAILAAVAMKKRGMVDRILVFGCLSQRYPEVLAKEIPEVDAFLGANDPEAVLKLMGHQWHPELACERKLSTPPHYAYLKISEGCDRSCAYCAIPLIRGPHISTPQEQLLREAELLADRGVKELLLVAQDTTFYGLDIYKKRSLAPLMERLAEVRGIEWLRLHYAYPAGFPEDVLELMAQHPKICSYLDIPLQHISTKVLTAMRRSVDEEQTRRLVDQMRSRVPGICLRTTMIVGHPGEDKRAFKQLLSFVETARFERLGAFCYSEEEGTYAAVHCRDSVPEAEKQERYHRLMELQAGISFAYNQSRVGTRERVLIDRREGDLWVGRSQYESPEVDGEIYISAAEPEEIGECLNGTFREVEIRRAEEYDLFGVLHTKR